jgi:hypothetical protein
MKTLAALIVALAAATTAHAEPLPGRDMTCRGPFDMYRGLGGHDVDVRIIGTPERTLCYLRGNPEASELVDAACKDKPSCIVRARVVPRDTPNGMPQTYNVLKVYSAKSGSSIDTGPRR